MRMAILFHGTGMSIFVDKSGLPSTWTNGTYEVNKKDFPVLGISWYEARAYKWAGKSLPTIYHWYKAAMFWGESGAISPQVISVVHQVKLANFLFSVLTQQTWQAMLENGVPIHIKMEIDQ